MRKIGLFVVIFTLLALNLRFFNAKNDVFATFQNHCGAMVVIEDSSKRILYSKDENKKLPMASTTKILTAIVAIENCSDLNQKHKIPKEAVGVEGSSIYLKTGEMFSILELLYGLMLRSGNDAAVAIAIIVAGSVESFVQLMNEKCNDLNLKNTHIVTVNGLHDDNHYTTAYELAVITSYAMQNEIFEKIVSSKEFDVFNENGQKIIFRNKNRFLNMVEGADGVKTGYTKKAGRCLVSSATKNGMRVICVVLNCLSMFEESAHLINKAFNEYSMVKLMSKGEILNLCLNEKKSQKTSIILKNDIIYPLKQDEIAKITASIKLKKEFKKHSDNEMLIGTFDVNLENNLIFSDKIYTIIIDKNAHVKDNFHKIIKAF